MLGRERGGSRPGLGKVFAQQLGSGAKIQMLSTVQWIESNALRARLIAISNGTLYEEEPVGTMASVGGTFHATKIIHAAERGQILYIADHSDTPATSSSTNQPKKFNPATATISNWTAATAGTIPYGSTCICLWRDRIVLSGGTTSPYGIFMSAQGDPEDWDYSATGVGAAVNLALADAGQIGDVVTAMAPHSDTCLIIGSPTQLWIIRGDPAFGGQADIISQEIGIVDRGAWCTTPDGVMVFLSQDGLYAMPKGCAAGNAPESLSREQCPLELLNVDKSTTTVSMAYDVYARGIHIFLTPASAGTPTHWWFDWETKGFWKVTVHSNYDPFCAHSRKNAVSDHSTVMLGCRDGYIRRFQTNLAADDSTNFTSYVFFGPFGESAGMHDTSLDEMAVTLAQDSGDVDWEIRTADCAEDAFEATAQESGEFTIAGRNNNVNPRVRGAASYIKLSNGESGVAWGFEGGVAKFNKRGKTRA